MQNVKIVLHGDAGSGKTSLMHTYRQSKFPSADEINPNNSIYSAKCNVMVDGKPIQLNIWDASHHHLYSRLRPLLYPQTDVVLICMDISNIKCYQSTTIKDSIVPEIRHHCLDVPIILLGTKSDFRWNMDKNNNETELLSIRQCKQLCIDIRACMYIEISAKYMELKHIKGVFDDAIRRSLTKQSQFRGIKLPKVVTIEPEIVYEELKDDQINITSNKLLVYGYIHCINSDKKLTVPVDIIHIIYSFYNIPKPLYYVNNTAGNYMLTNFGINKETKRNYYIMFWMDLLAIMLHNVCYLWFSMELLLVTSLQIMAGFALVFSVGELLIIIVSYWFLLFSSKIEYYTQVIGYMQLCMECFVNLPIIIIQMVYLLYCLKQKVSLILSFYFSISIYILYGLYKFIGHGIYWADKNKIFYERWYPFYFNTNWLIWMVAMFGLFILSVVKIAINPSFISFAFLLFWLSLCSMAAVGVMGYYMCVCNGKSGHRRIGLCGVC